MGLPYDLRLGVTGHRSVTDPAAVARAIDVVLDRIAATLNAPRTPLACTAISPLAEGADRLVAQAAITRLGARLEVVTPFPIAEYRADFVEASDRREFDALLERAAVVNELPGISLADAPHATADERRDAAYYRVGERVVDASEIVIAVWNGRSAAGPGGTADIIQHALRRERTVIWIHAEQPTAPARIIRGMKFGSAAADDQAVVETEPLPDSARTLSPAFYQQVSYFADAAVADESLRAPAAATRRTLTAAASGAGIPEGTLDGVIDALVPEFVRADALAVHYQRRHVWTVNGILRLAAAAVTVATAQILFFPNQLWIIAFEIAAMVIVFALWRGSRRGAWHEKWLHDRYLAEQLRAAMFTSFVGCGHPVPEERALGFYRGPQHWLTHVGTTLAAAARAAVPPVPLESLRRLMVDGWLRDQQRFHAGNAERKHRQAQLRHQLGIALFGATLLMALLHLLGVGHGDGHTHPLLTPGTWITFLALIFPVWAGAVHAITAQLELERVAERSARMAAALDDLAQRAERAISHGQLAEIAREASALMLRETQEWWVLLSFQDTRLHV